MNLRLLQLLAIIQLGTLACAGTRSAAPEQEPPLVLRHQNVPRHVLDPRPADFELPAGKVALHYYGAGGWGIRWRDTYVLTAPYFSNHTLLSLLSSPTAALFPVVPNLSEVRAGFKGTPVEQTQLVLIGHGHVDHTGDVPAFFGEGLISGRPTLIADRSTTNELAALKERFGCVQALGHEDNGHAAARCPTPSVRITPLHHGHAPHQQLLGLNVAAFAGSVKAPREQLPSRPEDYVLGSTWAFLIDLLDERGAVAFRIHYVDASDSPPHGFAPAALLAERDVDVHIACAAGFEQSVEYPDGLLTHLHARYALLAHWEDFLQPREAPLSPLRNVLDEAALERLVDVVERTLPTPRGVAPEGSCTERACGPRGATWALPVPGETFRFAAAAAPR